MSRTHQTLVEVCGSSSLEAEAGIETGLTIKVSCPSGCDLQGQIVRIRTNDGLSAGECGLVSTEAKRNETEGLTIKAPSTPGTYDWFAVFPAQEHANVRHQESSAPLVLNVTPHKTSLAMWDLSSPLIIGHASKIKVGAKCSAGCELTNQEVQVQSETGTRMASARLAATPWPGTSALYWSEVDLIAPDTEGTHVWKVTFAGDELHLPHQNVSSDLTFIAVKPPEHCATIQVAAKDTEAAVGDVEIRVGAYKARTDETGLATVEVPKGTYELNVWKPGFEAFSGKLEVNGDLTTQVLLVAAVEPEEEYWR